MAERDEFGAFLIGFIVGGLTGAAVSLLLAPQSGEETREYLRERAIELRDKGADFVQTAGDQVNETAGQVRQRAGEFADQARTQATELQRKGQVILEEQRSKISDRVQNLRNRGQQETGTDETTI